MPLKPVPSASSWLIPKYISKYANKDIQVLNVTDIIEFNNKDTLINAPYGQYLFNQIKKDKVSNFELNQMKINTKSLATNYLNKIISKAQTIDKETEKLIISQEIKNV